MSKVTDEDVMEMTEARDPVAWIADNYEATKAFIDKSEAQAYGGESRVLPLYTPKQFSGKTE